MNHREEIIRLSDSSNCPEDVKKITLQIYDTYKDKHEKTAFKVCCNLIDRYKESMDSFKKQLELLNKVHMRFNKGKKLYNDS